MFDGTEKGFPIERQNGIEDKETGNMLWRMNTYPPCQWEEPKFVAEKKLEHDR